MTLDSPEQLYGANTAFLSRFSPESLAKIKQRNDKNSGKREWLANVYLVGGRYELGEPTYGDYNGIQVSPSNILATDTNVCQLEQKSAMAASPDACNREGQLVSTIHMHPIRTLAEENRRQHFSGVDIASEYCKSRDNNEEVVLFLTYPDLSWTKRTNKVKAIVFPNRDVTVKAMAASNPGVDPMSITVEGRDKVDWIKYQDELEKMGYIEEIDIEQAVGAPASLSLNLVGVVLLAAVWAAAWAVVWA